MDTTESLQIYLGSKMKIYKAQNPGDPFIVNFDCEKESLLLPVLFADLVLIAIGKLIDLY